MKLAYLQKIIARVQQQIHCPKCKAAFPEESIEVRAVKGSQVEFSAECAHCQARSQISAEVSGAGVKPSLQREPADLKRPVSGFELPPKTLDKQTLEPLKQQLESFKGTDVRALFE